jgi:hypothetical protein
MEYLNDFSVSVTKVTIHHVGRFFSDYTGRYGCGWLEQMPGIASQPLVLPSHHRS